MERSLKILFRISKFPINYGLQCILNCNISWKPHSVNRFMTPLPIRFYSFLYRMTNNNGLIAQRKACAIPFNNKAPWTQTMLTKPYLRLFKTQFSASEEFNGLFERFPRSLFGVLKQIAHCLCWEYIPQFLFMCPDVLPRVGASSDRNSESPLRREDRNKSWTMLTLFENGVIKFQHDETRLQSFAVGETHAPYSKWTPQRQTTLIFFEKRTHRNHVWSSSCLLKNHQGFLFLPSPPILWPFNLVQLSYMCLR